MKLKYLLVCFAILTGLSFYFQFPQQIQNTHSAFSPVATNTANLIDIKQLTLADYEHISEKLNAVFVSRSDSQKQVYFDDKQLHSLELSPLQNQASFTYDSNETNELKKSELSLMIFNLGSGNTKEIFHTTFPSWDMVGNPHWLGNNHLVFLRHCGTSCQGLTLLNIQTGGVKNATLSYIPSSDRPAYTHFEDWFGNHHEVNDFVEKVSTQTTDDKPYLIFDMIKETGEKSRQEKFFFTGDSLVLEL